MSDDHTTAVVERYLVALAGDAPAEPVVRELLDRAVGRLRVLCASLLLRSYPRLTRPPLNLQADEMLGAVVERLLKAMRQVRPRSVREFFALANQHIRWELNDLARRLDEQPDAVELREGLVPAAQSSGSSLTPDARRILGAIEGLPDDEREVFGLVRIQGLTQAEVAEILGVSSKTVQRRLNRGLLLLAKRLDDLRLDEGESRSGHKTKSGGPGMPADPRVERLIEQILDSGSSAEVVCRDTPELLPEVLAGWRKFQAFEAQVGLLFPDAGSVDDLDITPISDGVPRVPGYDLVAVLGRGGVGVVYKAEHLSLHRTVALKMLLTGAFATRAERQRFAREAEVVAGLRHPNIVQVHDVGDFDGRPYFTMEFVEGGSLAEWLAGTPRPARQAAELLLTLALAIDAAHRGGIVHRDLKPSNVLLTADGTPKVGDFGLARQLEAGSSLTLSGAAVGTPSYMAPEQAQGRSGEIGPASDLYALGAILYEMLTGRPPFRAESAAETLHQVITRDPVPPSRLNAKVPRDLETICLKCLRKDPKLRYSSAAALAEDLRRFLSGEAIAARPENGFPESGKAGPPPADVLGGGRGRCAGHGRPDRRWAPADHRTGGDGPGGRSGLEGNDDFPGEFRLAPGACRAGTGEGPGRVRRPDRAARPHGARGPRVGVGG